MARVRPQRRDEPGTLFAPDALDLLSEGFDQLATVMAVTLGPTRGPILNSLSSGSVELLSDAGTIARRVVELPNRGRNVGAMILRHLAWRMHEQFGDGAATAAVLSRAMVREAVGRIAAGVDPMSIRGGLEQALPAALAAIAAHATPVDGQDALEGVATGITGDPDLGAVLGEIVDLLGSDAAITIEEFPVPYLDREYIAGAAWRAHPATRAMIPEGREEIVLENPLILLVDQHLAEVEDVRPTLELAAQSTQRRPLLVISVKIDDHALATLTANHARGTVNAIAAKLSSIAMAHTDDLGDIAALTGGSVFADVLGRSPLRTVREDLGSARKAVLSRDTLTIVGGAGDAMDVADRTSRLRRGAARLAPSTMEWKRLQGRIARLSGGCAILKLGALSGTELRQKRAQAEKAFLVLTGVLGDGVVPGGGVAYLECLPVVQCVRERCTLPGYEHGVDVLLTALEAPFGQITRNHGVVHPPLALEEVRRLGCGYGFDVLTGMYVDMRRQGILDSVRVTRGALELATSAAISVITTGVVVLPPAKRERRVKP
jgi:chaperonin GroEL